jgi:hypothetical protein
VTGSTIFGAVPAWCHVERTIAICSVGDCKLPVSSVSFKRKRRHWKLVTKPFPTTVQPSSCLGVVIGYIATSTSGVLKLPRCCDPVISSDDPTDPVKTLEVLAATVWKGSCAKCCDDCRKGSRSKQHGDCCRCCKCGGDRGDEEEDGEPRFPVVTLHLFVHSNCRHHTRHLIRLKWRPVQCRCRGTSSAMDIANRTANK